MHEDGLRPAVSHKKSANEFHGLLRGREANARWSLRRQRFKTFERERKMRSPLIVRNGVNFIHDHSLNRAKQLAAFSRSKQDVERFRSSDQDVRRPLLHGTAFARQRIAGPHGSANLRHQETRLLGELENLTERFVEISLA